MSLGESAVIAPFSARVIKAKSQTTKVLHHLLFLKGSGVNAALGDCGMQTNLSRRSEYRRLKCSRNQTEEFKEIIKCCIWTAEVKIPKMSVI